MGFSKWWMKHGLGSPASMAKTMTKCYLRIKSKYPSFSDEQLLALTLELRIQAEFQSKKINALQPRNKEGKEISELELVQKHNWDLKELILYVAHCEISEVNNAYLNFPDLYQQLIEVLDETVDKVLLKYGQGILENTAMDSGSMVIDCPICKQKLRIPTEQSLQVNCSSCNSNFDYPINNYDTGFEYYEMKEEEEGSGEIKTIITCNKCGQGLKIPIGKNLSITCNNCKYVFDYSAKTGPFECGCCGTLFGGFAMGKAGNKRWKEKGAKAIFNKMGVNPSSKEASAIMSELVVCEWEDTTKEPCGQPTNGFCKKCGIPLCREHAYSDRPTKVITNTINDYISGTESYDDEEEKSQIMDEDEQEVGMQDSGGTTTAEDDSNVTIDKDKNYYNYQLDEKEPVKTFSDKNKELKHKKKKPPANLKKIVESILFVAQEPVSARKISNIIEGTNKKEILKIVKQLRKEYAHTRVFSIEEIANGFQFLLRPEYHKWISKIRKKSSDGKLSQPALETLAIIAYKQPIIRADIEAIRGVQSGQMLRTLVERGFVKITGRDEVLGRPFLYGTTTKFLDHFGLKSTKDLPKGEDL